MRWSQCGGRERYRAKGKIVAEDGVFGPIVRTSFLSVQATCKEMMKIKIGMKYGMKKNTIERNWKCLALEIENFIQ